jgi:hypothetical protein
MPSSSKCKISLLKIETSSLNPNSSSYVCQTIILELMVIKVSSSSPTREVSHDPRDTKQAAPRKSSRIKNKQLMQASKRSVNSKESKAPEIIKSLSSSEKPKLASLRTPKKGRHENDDDNDDSMSNSSSKKSFRGSPDLSRGIEKFNS